LIRKLTAGSFFFAITSNFKPVLMSPRAEGQAVKAFQPRLPCFIL
jgi:hypothetical protein